MKAAVLHAYDESLDGHDFVKCEDVPDPRLQRVTDVIVRIGGAGVCRTDLHIFEGIWPSKVNVTLPFIMGHENAGWVEAVGRGVESVKVGDAVIRHPLVTSGHHHHHHHHHNNGLSHVNGIASVCLALDQPLDRSRFMAWLQRLVMEQGQNLLPAKGIVWLAGADRRFVFQGVHLVMDSDFAQALREGEARGNRLVFIGRDLDEADLRASLAACQDERWQCHAGEALR